MKDLRILAVGLTLAGAACNHGDPTRAQERSASQPPAQLSMGSPSGIGDDAGDGDAGPSQPPGGGGRATPFELVSDTTTTTLATTTTVDAGPRLSNDQILQVTRTADEGEIEQAELAHARSRDGRVQKLAAMMLRDHTEAETKGEALARKEELSPEPSPASESLETDAKGVTRTLKAESGPAFDRFYVRSQVREHEAVLNMLSAQLLPSSTNPELSAYLHEVKASVSAHLEHARALQRELGK